MLIVHTTGGKLDLMRAPTMSTLSHKKGSTSPVNKMVNFANALRAPSYDKGQIPKQVYNRDPSRNMEVELNVAKA